MVTETGSYWHAVLREVLFRLGYRVHSEVEDRGGEDGIRLVHHTTPGFSLSAVIMKICKREPVMECVGVKI